MSDKKKAKTVGFGGCGADPSVAWNLEHSPYHPKNSYEKWKVEEDLGPIHRTAGLLLANGISHFKTERILDLPRGCTKIWVTNPTFRQFILDNKGRHEDLVIESLLVGERRAASKLVALLDSTNEEIVLKAALSLLDRKGKRGFANRQLDVRTLSATVTPEDLRRALLDPGVRARMKEIPGLAEMVNEEVVQLSSGEDELRSELQPGEEIAEVVYLPVGQGAALSRLLPDPSVPETLDNGKSAQ